MEVVDSNLCYYNVGGHQDSYPSDHWPLWQIWNLKRNKRIRSISTLSRKTLEVTKYFKLVVLFLLPFFNSAYSCFLIVRARKNTLQTCVMKISILIHVEAC